MFDAVIVDRAMAQSAPPTLTEIGPLIGAKNIKITEALNQAESLTLTIAPALQEDEVRTRFADPLDGCEVWVNDRETGARLFAGPFRGYAPQLTESGIVWEVRASGLLGYLSQMLAPEPTDTTLIFNGVDQALIAKALVDYWQALDYGHYGIDTSGVATTGVFRDRTYEVPEMHVVSQRVAELGAVGNGFDHSIHHTTRDFNIHYPTKGGDKTDLIVVDARNIIDPQSQISVGPHDSISDAYAVSSDTGLTSHVHDPAIRAKFGRSGLSAAWQGIANQPTLDDHAQRLLDQHDTHLHDLGVTAYPIGFAWGDFETGDLVEYVYDYGAGDIKENRRVVTREFATSDAGVETIKVKVA